MFGFNTGAWRVESGPPEPFFTFKTTFEGEVSFSITKSGTPATWYMGDGTIIANTNSVTHAYADDSEKTVSVSVVDSFLNVTSIEGIVSENVFKAVTEFDMTVLESISTTSLIVRREPIALLVTPYNFNGFLNVDGANQSSLFTEITNCVYSSLLPIDRLQVARMTNNAIIDISNIETNGRLSFGGVSLSGTSARQVIFPASNSNNHSNFELISISNQGATDLSGYTGNIGVININTVQQMASLILPNLSGTNSIAISLCAQLNSTVVLNNGAGLCNFTQFQRNGNNATFDLTNFNFGTNINTFTFGVNACRKVILPALNPNNFSTFVLNGHFDQGNIDMSGFTGNFSGTLTFIGLGNTQEILLPPNISGVTNLTIGTTSLNQTLVLDNGVGNATNSTFNRLLNNAIIDISNFNCSNSLRFTAFGLALSCSRVIPCISNSNAFTTFEITGVDNQGDLDLSGFSGNFTGNFILTGINGLTSLILPTGDLTGLTNFTIYSCNYGADLNIGTDIIAQNISFFNSVFTTSNISYIINSVDANTANFPLGAKSINFGNSTITSNEVPDAATITKMSALAASDNFTFTYWDGSANVVITP